MRVLLLHPQDSPFEGPWARESWDMVADLAWAGSCTYAEWGRKLNCPVVGLYNLGKEMVDVRDIRDTLRAGRGELIDEEGIDWWELMAPARYAELHEQLLLARLKSEMGPDAEIRATRPHRLVSELEAAVGRAIQTFLRGSDPGQNTQNARRWLRPLELLGVAFDKWDADLRIRRFLASLSGGQTPDIAKALLPSSYVNVSRMLAGYATALPTRQFLLVTTRAAGELQVRPGNVAMRSLAAYAPIPTLSKTKEEIRRLASQWEALAAKLRADDQLGLAIRGRLYDLFPRWLRVGLRVRDAWRRVIEREAINAVLCADENNHSNRLATLLARKRKIATASCSHGALDVNVLLRGVAADVYLARGPMEEDYLLRRCDVSPQQVMIGAPGALAGIEQSSDVTKDQVVLFSEPYELYRGRVDLFYGEVLPQLAAVACRHGKKVVIKLHPFENIEQRRKLVASVLPPETHSVVEVTKEALSVAFLNRTWFALTVESSVAVECALRKVPSFLCGWFELGLYGYGHQYEKFGAARMLHNPAEILNIPGILDAAGGPAAVSNALVQVMSPQRIDEILNGKHDSRPVVANG